MGWKECGEDNWRVEPERLAREAVFYAISCDRGHRMEEVGFLSTFIRSPVLRKEGRLS